MDANGIRLKLPRHIKAYYAPTKTNVRVNAGDLILIEISSGV